MSQFGKGNKGVCGQKDAPKGRVNLTLWSHFYINFLVSGTLVILLEEPAAELPTQFEFVPNGSLNVAEFFSDGEILRLGFVDHHGALTPHRCA